MRIDLPQFAFPVSLCQFRHLTPIGLRRGEPQFLFEGLFQNLDVFVFAKYQRHHDPVIARADLPIGAAKSEKGFVLPA